jgi:hypothetical protein
MKKLNIEEKKRELYEEEREKHSKVKALQEKEFYLTEKFEEFDRRKKDIEESSRKLEKEQRDTIIALKRLDDDIKLLEEKNRLFEKEKETIVRKYQEIETERAIMNSDKLKIEQDKAELRLRIQSLDVNITLLTIDVESQVCIKYHK